MQVHVVYNADELPADLYEQGLAEVDVESQMKIKRFYHKADSYRCLIGRLLPRRFLQQYGISKSDIAFDRTAAGKPLITTPEIKEKIGFNISHDNSLVVMAVQIANDSDLPAKQPFKDVTTIGVDCMRISLPRYEKSLEGFVKSLEDALTLLERNHILDTSISQTEGLQRLYLVWCMKEAYTKALGLGLGFDFKRLEHDVLRNRFTVDGASPQAWEFVAFIQEVRGGKGHLQAPEQYQIVVARLMEEGREASVQLLSLGTEQDVPWLNVIDASTLVRTATNR